jgi:hypothetical protein
VRFFFSPVAAVFFPASFFSAGAFCAGALVAGFFSAAPFGAISTVVVDLTKSRQVDVSNGMKWVGGRGCMWRW